MCHTYMLHTFNVCSKDTYMYELIIYVSYIYVSNTINVVHTFNVCRHICARRAHILHRLCTHICLLPAAYIALCIHKCANMVYINVPKMAHICLIYVLY